MSDTYPQDDFDDLPEGSPVGVHRKPRNPWQPVIPFLIVLIVVPLLAWGVTALIQRNVPADELADALGQSPDQQSEDAGVQSEDVPPVTIPDSDVPTAAPDDPNEQPDDGAGTEDAAVVDYAAAISVLNGSGIDGLAAQSVERLVAAGFTNAVAGNASLWPTDQNTVFYPSSDMRATAQAVAAAAGITQVVEDPAAEVPGSIVVFLVN